MSKKQQQDEQPEAPHPTQDYEDRMVASQWEQAKSLGLLEQHPESINPDGAPKEI